MNRRALVVAVALLLCASTAFAGMAWNSPVKPTVYNPAYPSQCVPATLMNTNPCNTYILPAYFQQVYMDSTPYTSYWFYRSYVEIAEGFMLLAILLPLLWVKRLDSTCLRKPFAPRFPKRLVVPLAIVGASVFALFPISATWPEYEHTSYYLDLHKVWFAVGLPLGVTAFGVWCLTALVLSTRKGIVGAMEVFGLPSVLYLACMVFVFDRAEMTNHVTMFLSLSLYGVPLVSNWLVLMVASFLFVYAWTYRRLGLR